MDCQHPKKSVCSLLLAATDILLALAGDDFSKHDDTVAIHEGNARETLAVLEAVAHKWLLWLEAALSHLVRLERVRLLKLLATGLLAHLPLEGRDTACSTAAAHETNWGVSNLDLVWNIKDLDLRCELLGLAKGGILLVDHDITRAWHVLLVKTLDVQANVVTWVSKFSTLMMHLDGEHLAGARVGCSVRWEEDNFLTWLHDTLLDASGEHITDTLDLVDARDWHAHWCRGWASWDTAQLVQHIIQGIHVESLTLAEDVTSLPPVHILRLLDEVVTHPSRDWEDWGALLNEVLLPADLHQHRLHLVGNLIVTGLLVSCSVAIHLVHTNAELLHTEKVDEACVLAGLTLDLAGLVVTPM